MARKETLSKQDDWSMQQFGLTHSQVKDCMQANRSPKTGKRYRTSPPTPLEIKCKKVNWARLRVKGASIALVDALQEMVITENESLELVKTIRKLETLLLNKLAQGYEITRFENWQAEASKKNFSD